MDETIVQDFVDLILDLDDFPESKSFRQHFLRDFIFAIVYAKDFVITLAKLATWLSVFEANLKRTLVRHYKPNEDYKIVKQKPLRGRPKENILLTTDCFKRLCMRGRTPQAEQMRTYFILVEERYREFMTNGIENRIWREDEAVTEKKRRTPFTELKLDVSR